MNIYSNVKISNQTNDTLSNCSQKKILYFSDGTLEVDELGSGASLNLDSTSVPVNPQELTWIPWMWYQTASVGSKALEVCDYLGESLASFFGITTPKYQFELNEYYRLKKQVEEEIKNDIEMGDWTNKFNSNEAENRAVSAAPKMFDKSNDST